MQLCVRTHSRVSVCVVIEPCSDSISITSNQWRPDRRPLRFFDFLPLRAPFRPWDRLSLVDGAGSLSESAAVTGGTSRVGSSCCGGTTRETIRGARAFSICRVAVESPFSRGPLPTVALADTADDSRAASGAAPPRPATGASGSCSTPLAPLTMARVFAPH